ncbi:MAG TPA: hypothetical protein VH083_20620 [Myxococcales bacterium]|jgi:hypothetical protein|nr:hypothetical protein [Myxococcales bacterium]
MHYDREHDAQPAAPAGLLVPWAPGHQSLLLDAWPEETWREVLCIASPVVALPRQIGGLFEGTLTDGWRARASTVHSNEEAARREFALLADWLRKLGASASGSRCIVLGGSQARGFCAWQLLQQPPTLEAEVRRLLEAKLPARDAVAILTSVSVAFVEAHHLLSAHDKRVPVRFSTLSMRKNRTAVFAGFLPREPAPQDAPSVWVLEEELRKIFRPGQLASFAVPDALRELALLMHSHPEESEILELLQSILQV